MVGQLLWSVGMEGYRWFSFLSFLRGEKITSAFFNRCHNRRQPFWHSLISLSILFLLTNDRKVKWSIKTKKEAQDSDQMKTMNEALAILREDFFNCIFIYDQNLGFCVSYVLFGGSCAVWGPLCFCGFFTTIYLLWWCPTTDTFSWTAVSHLPSTQFCHWAKSMEILRVREK